MKLISSLVAGAHPRDRPGPSLAAIDTFTRVVASGWGTADTGGAWTADSSPGSFSVGGTSGRLVLAAGGQNRAIFLAPTAVDWDVTTDVSLDKAPTGGGSAWIYHEVRRATSNTNCYRLVARFAGNGSTYLSASRVVEWRRGADRQRGRRADRQLPHRLHAARAGDGHEPDDDQHQGLGRYASPRPGSTPAPTAPARRSPAAAGCAATPRRASPTRR